MGQQEVIREIEKQKFTTLDELSKRLSATKPSISHSLTSLVRWREITSVKLGRTTIYISNSLI